ncbi:MAG: hypothetical protein KDD62_01640, partial [Bdellovibrionales bacterium]|nr:hypothetical protein [Bdellovibrionales bacterium]
REKPARLIKMNKLQTRSLPACMVSPLCEIKNGIAKVNVTSAEQWWGVCLLSNPKTKTFRTTHMDALGQLNE